jgi:hypothetical protein
MVLTVRHGPNFAPPGTFNPNRKKAIKGLKRFSLKIGLPLFD